MFLGAAFFHQSNPELGLVGNGLKHFLNLRAQLMGGADDPCGRSAFGLLLLASLFFEFLEQHSDDLLAKDGAVLSQVILRCCAIKAEVVSADERESGRRAILNYGHTFGHGIEKLCGYGQWLHGEAVAIGMVMAARLSVAVAGLDESVVMRLTALLRRLGLPTALDQASRKVATIEAMMDVMGLDKKVVDGRLRFIVASQLGQVQVRDDIDAAVVRNVLAQC